MNIDVYTNAVAGGWHPDDVDKFLGANEETLVLWGEALASYGHQVSIYTTLRDPTGTLVSCGRKGVQYFQREAFDPLKERECLITYKDRTPWSRGANLSAKLRGHWSMDVEQPWPAAVLNKLHFFGTLGPFHESLMPWLPVEKRMRLPLGIDLAEMTEVIERAHVARHKVGLPEREELALYTTSPDRGLDTLLADWPRINRAHGGKLRLAVTYDFSRLARMGGPQGAQRAEQLARTAQAVGAQITGALDKTPFYNLLAVAKYYIHPLNRKESDLFGYGAFRAWRAGLLPVLNYFEGWSFADTLGLHVPYRRFMDGDARPEQHEPPVKVLSWKATVERDWLSLLDHGRFHPDGTPCGAHMANHIAPICIEHARQEVAA